MSQSSIVRSSPCRRRNHGTSWMDGQRAGGIQGSGGTRMGRRSELTPFRTLPTAILQPSHHSTGPSNNPASSMSITPPRSLASLPDIVLREVLAYVLVNVPRVAHRAAVLATCSVLHQTGLPFLYRVLDIRTNNGSRLRRYLDVLFSARDGLVTRRGRYRELGRHVVEILVGGTLSDKSNAPFKGQSISPLP